MKYLIFSILILFSCSGPCIQGEGNLLDSTRKLKEFNGVNLDFPATLVIHHTDNEHERSINLLAQSNVAEVLSTDIVDGVLVIKSNKCMGKYTPITLDLYTDLPLNQIALNGSGEIVGKDELVLENSSISLSGSGNIDVKGNANQLKISLNGSGTILIGGSATDLDLHLNGSGDIRALDLQAKRVKIENSGSGDVNVYATEELGFSLSGSGNLMYRGNPRITKEKKSGSGDVNKLGEY
ncbi:MAG: head GIN domain-containing protein [Flavobacteriales bacterium]|nr:head GIN domain-containing protein [Flavobacteriales bacterium]